MNWTNYRWSEGVAILNNHSDRKERHFYNVSCVSARLADFCLKHNR